MAISIVSLLAAMLLPRLHRTKEYAKRAFCMNNARQIALGFQSYSIDFKDQFPMNARWLDDFYPVYPYVGSLNVFKCPSTTTKNISLTTVSGQTLLVNTDYYSAGTVTDIERNGNYNNGLGNNPYNFDPSNKGNKVTTCLEAKKYTPRVVYEAKYNNHIGRMFNVIYVSDLHYEIERNGVTAYWTLDKQGYIETDVNNPFPTYK
jgi:type II secretory pathway pseudopilin PulG